ncbi:MAG TPA: hypothetical protein VJU86_09655 [Pyrinomonadaceae bacterium]|nr:hypothetical protein [Pyrinomonadaceae bacterium]
MSTILEVEKLALDLPERERAALTANLLDSLTGVLSEGRRWRGRRATT